MNFLQLFRKDKSIRIAFFIALFVWLLLAFTNVFGFSRYYLLYFDESRTEAVHMIEPQLRSITEKLELFSVNFILDEAVEEDDFALYAETLMKDTESIDYIMFSPSGDVTNVYPMNSELIGVELINGFDISEYARFVTSLEEDTYLLTYEYDDNEELEKLHFHKSAVLDGDFVGLVTIVVDVETLVSSFPNESVNEELVLVSPDGVYILNSSKLDEGFISEVININGLDFEIATDFYGSYFVRTVIMAFLATLLVTTPIVLFFVFFFEEQRRSIILIADVEFSRNYSLDTNLKNARSFYRDIDKLIEENQTYFVALGTFNNIKYINDKYGHTLGQSVILEAVRLITGVLRSNTELYHFGGDEYTFVIKTESKSEVNNILKRVLKIFDRDIVIDRIRTNISMTMGVVKYPTQARNIDELIKNAHLTISNSNILNSNAFAFYKKDVISNLASNQDFDNYVKNLNLELFEVYVMPIIDVETNLIVGFECLTRAFNEFDEMLDTETVVNSLERSGRIQELDEIVFVKMLRMMRRLNKTFEDQDFFLSVNASALSFNENYVNKVIDLYEAEHFTKGTIVLELTESYQVEDYDYLIRLFKRLNAVGIKTAIDDFGSGYSSLSYISKFPIYAIKVDKTYVRDYLTNSFNRTLFMTLKSISEVLDCKLVAEGVDDPETLDFLRKNNCELYQGFLFSKGVTFEQSIKMIKKNLSEYSQE